MDQFTNTDIIKILKAIKELFGRNSSTWPKWKQVSKKIWGTESKAFDCSIIASQPENKDYFVIKEGTELVKLSEKGIKKILDSAKIDNNQISKVDEVYNSVISYANSLHALKIKVLNGYKVKSIHNKSVYCLTVESNENYYSENTPIKIFSSDHSQKSDGKIIGFELDNSIIYVSLEYDITNEVKPGILCIERSFLFSSLAKSIKKAESIEFIIKILQDKDFQAGKYPSNNIENKDSAKMAEALEKSLVELPFFLWGPPGSGKTFTICELVVKRLRESKNDYKILITAPSNFSVDVLTFELIERIKYHNLEEEYLDKEKIFRYGYPQKKSILETAAVIGPKNKNDLQNKIKDVSNRLSEAESNNAKNDEIAVLRAELLSYQEELKKLSEEHLMRCNVVLTTTAQIYHDESPCQRFKWDLIILDEATMTPPAVCVFLWSLSKGGILFAGDPRQLGPVFESNNTTSKDEKLWMGTDIFEFSKLSEGSFIDKKIRDDASIMTKITSQRRCNEKIWSYVSHLYNNVTTLNNASAEANNIAPGYGKSVVILDTRAYERNIATTNKHYESWNNSYSAELVMEIVCSLVSDLPDSTSIGIITPYKAQHYLIKSFLREEQISNKRLKKIEVGTVHQFQGSAADIIIFDLVDGYGKKPEKLSPLLKGDTGLRLVNVAITRARTKLIVIVDFEWMRKNLKKDENPLLWNLIFETPKDNILKVNSVDEPKLKELSESPIEQRLYDGMKNREKLKHFKQQICIRDKKEKKIISRADFAFVKEKIAIYCDGAKWHCTENQWQRDIRQRNKLTNEGWKFLVFSGSDINNNLEQCLKDIELLLVKKLGKKKDTTMVNTAHNKA